MNGWMDMFDMLSTRIAEHATPATLTAAFGATTTTTMWSKEICDTSGGIGTGKVWGKNTR